MLDCLGSQGTAQGHDVPVNIKTVYCVDAAGEQRQGRFFHAAGGGAEQGRVHMTQFLHVAYGLDAVYSFAAGAAHDTCQFHIGSGAQGVHSVFPDVAVSYNGYFNHLGSK